VAFPGRSLVCGVLSADGQCCLQESHAFAEAEFAAGTAAFLTGAN
jgi:hypothetical protein